MAGSLLGTTARQGNQRSTASFLLSLATVACCWELLAADASLNQVLIHADQTKETINRNVYGHFSEHLGRCIYEGVSVGKDSSIPNTRGIRKDVVAALRQLKIRCCVGQEAVSRMSITGATEWGHANSGLQ